MKRWRVIIVVIAVVVIAAVTAYQINGVKERRARERREAGYQSTLKSYADSLRPGMTRKEVESYLRSRNVSYQQVGIGTSRAASLVTKIGEEPPPWYCSEQNVYVAMEFIPVRQHDPWEGDDTDILAQVHITNWGERCL